MTYGQVDDQLHGHPKAHTAGLAAMGLWTLAMSHCMAYLTDGKVCRATATRLAGSDVVATELGAVLVAAGLWHVAADGWVFAPSKGIKQPDVARLVRRRTPPPRRLYFGYGDGTVLASVPSFAWYEWHWRRGLHPGREAIPIGVRLHVLRRDGLACGICGGEVDAGDVHLDHVVPVARGGPTVARNLRVTHSKCNLRKGSK